MKKLFIIIFLFFLSAFPSYASQNDNTLKNLKEPTNEAEALEIKNTLLEVHAIRYNKEFKKFDSFSDQVIKNNKCGSTTRCKKIKEILDIYKLKMTLEYNKNKEIIEANHQILIKPFAK